MLVDQPQTLTLAWREQVQGISRDIQASRHGMQ